MNPIVDIRQATKRFEVPEGGQVTALDAISLSVARNEFLTLLGPSGCGKTTLLRVISGFEDLDAGEILIDGQPVTGQPAYKRPVNTVFQNYALFPHLSVARNLSYSLDVAKVAKPEIRGRVAKMLDLVGLTGLDDRKINQLSGGQQQRVALARSLIARPKVLLLDEPLSALDKNLRHKMQQELKSLQSELGISFVFVTHDQEEALIMSDRIAVLNQGRIEQLDTPEALYRRPVTEFVARFIGDSNLFPGEVRSLSRDKAVVELKSGQSVGVDATGLSRGDRIKLLVRPEDVIAGSGDAAEGFLFSGRITQVYFVGTDYQLVVSVPGMADLKATMRQGAHMSAVNPAPGHEIALFVPRQAVHVVANGGTPFDDGA